MGNSVDLSVVLPAFKEEDNLRLLLPRLHKTLTPLVGNYEIIVVDAVSPVDNTREVCTLNNVEYVSRENSNSFGDAVRSGIRKAKGKYVIFMDADGSHPPEFIARLYEYSERFDIVIASRYVDGGWTENSKLLTLMSRVLNITYSLVLNLDCKDVSNSYRLYRGDLLRSGHYSSHNFDIVEEILFKLNRSRGNLKIKEVPFLFKKRMFGKTKRNLVAFMATYLFTLLKLRFSK